MVESLRGAGHVGPLEGEWEDGLVAAEHHVAAHPGGEVDDDVDPRVADPLDHLGVQLGRASADSRLRIADVDVDDRRPRLGGVDRRSRDLLGGDGDVRAPARGVAGAGDRTRDEHIPVHVDPQFRSRCRLVRRPGSQSGAR